MVAIVVAAAMVLSLVAGAIGLATGGGSPQEEEPRDDPMMLPGTGA